MDRNIVYPGAIPLDTDVLQPQRNAMVALGYFLRATLGTSTIVDGLACTPTAPASMTVNVGPGSITQLSTIDATAYGSLAADTTDPLMKMGINAIGSTPFSLTAPTTSGQSINYLIEAAFQETDQNPVVDPYYNAADPSQPFSGPGNTGTAQNTVRAQRVELQMKAGAPANAGTQTTPPVDTGYVGLYVITVNYGQSTVTASNITTLYAAPFLKYKLPQLAPGFSNIQVFSSAGSSTFTVQAGVTQIYAIVTGGGGGGSQCAGTNSSSDMSGAGGGAGGTSIGIYPTSPGEVLQITVGSGGATQQNGASSSVGSLVGATGGQGASFQSAATSAGGECGYGYGGQINLAGGYGSDGQSNGLVFAGNGGASYWGGGGRASFQGINSNGQMNGQAPGSGGGGAYNSSSANGGSGGPGIVVIMW